MNKLSDILFELALGYFEKAVSSDRECRLLLPAPLKEIACETHNSLRGKGIRSFLVIGKDECPSEEKGWLQADGLTSERVGSFVAVCSPGVLSHLQDSISGTGGTIRSLSFSDEWPWVDNGPEHFGFKGEILPRICKTVSADTTQYEFISLTILELISSSSSVKDRQELVLGEILGAFDAVSYPTIHEGVEKFLFHSGLPRTNEAIYGKEYLENLMAVSIKITEELKVLERIRLFDSVEEKFAGENVAKRQAIKSALEDFLDGLGSSEQLPGILLTRNGFAGNQKIWTELSLEVLEGIFGKDAPRAKIDLEISFSTPRGISHGNSVAMFKGDILTCFVNYQFPEVILTREILLLHKNKVLEVATISDREGTVTFTIDTGVLFSSYRNKISITVRAQVYGQKEKEKKGVIHLCGEERPGFLVLSPNMVVIDPLEKIPEDVEQDEIGKLKVNEPVDVFVLTCGAGKLLDENLDELDVTPVKAGIVKLCRLLNPCESPTGSVTIYANIDGNTTSAICIEATEVTKGEFTLEDEFRNLLATAPGSSRFNSVLDIFSGKSREQYRNLGSLNEKTNKLTFLARFFEIGEHSYLPVVVDLAGGLTAIESVLTCARVAKNVTSPTALNEQLSGEVISLIEVYSNSRKKLFDLVEGSIDIAPNKLDRPLYAETPLFVDSGKEIIQAALSEFLDSYLAILSFLEMKRQTIGWGEFFLLSYLDCVVDLGTTHGGKFYLLGPWHPLVVCKRFFVASSLFRSAMRFSRKETKSGFNILASLLRFVTPARWSYSVDKIAKGFKKTYLASLSDPAWILGLSIGDGSLSSDEVKSILVTLASNLGLDSNVLPASSEHLAGSYVKDYLNAYPSRRAIGMRIEGSYMPRQVISSLDNLFVPIKGVEISPVALSLPGGIHSYFDSPTMDIECSSRPEASKVFIYEDHEEQVARIPVDMTLLPPIRDISFSKYEDSPYRLPRGLGDETVFYTPLARLVSGLEAIPTSQVLEEDTHNGNPSTLEGRFLNMVCALARLAAKGTCTNLQANLPENLNCSWNVLPGMQLDPAIFRHYVRAGEKKKEDRALWDYNIDIDGRMNTYYILSRVPGEIIKSLNQNPVLGDRPDLIRQILGQLGEIGIAVGSEAMKTSSRALGVVGLVAAIRLFTSNDKGISAPLRNSDSEVGFLLPVDSFKEFLGELNSESQKRADLLAVQVYLPKEGVPMRLSACAIECKYSSTIYPDYAAQEALGQQALNTIENFKYLVQASKTGGTPEKLALLNLVNFGLRTLATESPEWIKVEQEVLRAILENNFDFVEPRCGCVLVSTEIGLNPDSAKFNERHGYWIRLAPGCWPGTGDHENLDYSRKILSSIFKGVHSENPAKVTSTIKSTCDLSNSEETPDRAVASLVKLSVQADAIVQEKLVGGSLENITPAVAETESSTVLSPEYEQSVSEGVRFLVGKGIDMTRAEYLYSPSNTKLTHLNTGIAGDLGTGKTQLIQSLIYNLSSSACENRGVPPKFLILDYKRDYSDPEKAGEFIKAVGAQILEPYKMPLSLFDVGNEAKPVDKVNKANFFIDVLKKIYGGIGPVQEMKLRQAIKDCYDDASLTGTIPTMRNVYEKYYHHVGGTPDSPLSILDNLCSLEVFEDDHSKLVPFSTFFDKVTVVNLGYFGSDDQSKNMLVVFFLNIFYDYMIKLQKKPYIGQNPQLRHIDSMLLVDEADNIMRHNFPVLKQLLQQGREFGVGVLLASQYLSHFRTSAVNYAEPLLTWFIHNVPNINKNELQSFGLTGVTDETIDKIKKLGKHECFYKSLDVPGRFMRGTPFYELMQRKSREEANICS